MTNSMDGILVQYGVSFSPEERRLIDQPADDEEETKELKAQIKKGTLPKFWLPL